MANVNLEDFNNIKNEDKIDWSLYWTDLTKLAVEGKLDPVIGRDKEIARAIQILCMRRKNNPILLGEPGVGKTAIAEGVAMRIAAKNVPLKLVGARVLSISMAAIVAGTRFRGEFEERLLGLLEHLKGQNVVMFIDEIHTVIGAGGREGGLDASNIMKPALARGELRCMGATTSGEFNQYIRSDAALDRRFRPLIIGEPSQASAIQMLSGLAHLYENHHGVNILPEAVEAAVTMSAARISHCHLPDKAIDIIDETGARLSILRPGGDMTVADIQETIDTMSLV